MSLFKNVNVVNIIVSDWERAKKFYGGVLDWPVAIASDDFNWVEYGRENESHVSISRWPGPGPMPEGQRTTLVLTVDDADAVTRELRARGIRCDDVQVVPGMVSYGAFYDPDGNQIQFAGPPPAE